jgi:outer membrane receptor for Fe3+-dicitrate
LQPRISASAAASKSIKFNAAWGIYNQFIIKSSVLDELGNYRYIWTSSDNKNVPVLNAQHYIAGTSYHKEDLTISIETYFKNVDGLTRFLKGSATTKDAVYQGKGRSYGMDFYVKKEFRGHSAWIAYTLSKTEEKFPYFQDDKFLQAPQDQRHELKLAAIIDLRPFYLSGNYIFGSGFPINRGTIDNPDFTITKYNRFDLALNYRFRMKKVYGEIGCAILNVFDTKNIRYSNFEMVPIDQENSINIYSEAVPFSPRISLKLSM